MTEALHDVTFRDALSMSETRRDVCPTQYGPVSGVFIRGEILRDNVSCGEQALSHRSVIVIRLTSNSVYGVSITDILPGGGWRHTGWRGRFGHKFRRSTVGSCVEKPAL